MNEMTVDALFDELEKISRARWLVEAAKSDAPARLKEYKAIRSGAEGWLSKDLAGPSRVSMWPKGQIAEYSKQGPWSRRSKVRHRAQVAKMSPSEVYGLSERL